MSLPEMTKEPEDRGPTLSADARPRLRWTRQLHESFVDAVAKLGGADKVTPKSLMRAMRVPGLTLYHLKSHLQKYRLAKNRDPHANIKKQDITMVTDCRLTENGTVEDGSQPYHSGSMLQIQLEVQRKLQEQIEVQKHLQLRIEAQGKYLQSVLRKAQETISGYSSNIVGVETAKAELSELFSAVDTDCPSSSSFSHATCVAKQVQNADCSTDSCLTSSDKLDAEDGKGRKVETSDCSYNWSDESAETNQNRSRAFETESRCLYQVENDVGLIEEFDLNH